MSHFSHTNVYFIREDEEDTLYEEHAVALAAVDEDEDVDDEEEAV